MTQHEPALLPAAGVRPLCDAADFDSAERSKAAGQEEQEMSNQPGRCIVQGCEERRAFAQTTCWAHQGSLAYARALNALTAGQEEQS